VTQNIFLYFSYFAAFGSLTQFALSFTSLSRAPSPELARRGMRTTGAFSLALAVPFGLLGIGESLAWFANDPVRKLWFMGGTVAVEAAILFLYVRAMRPISAELQRVRQQGAA
jgi:hypothetical protein